MLKYALALRSIKDLIIDRSFVRPEGEGHTAEAALDLIMETVSVLDYDCDYLPGAEITQVVNDSRQVIPGAIFTAIAGSSVNGEKFALDAQQKGACVVVSQQPLGDVLQPGCVNLIVSDAYSAYAKLCNAFYNFPAEQFFTVGVTGTNGKTTTAMLFRKMLQQNQQKCGMISTVEYDLGNHDVIPADRTTPEAGRLFDFFSVMRKNQTEAMIMEVSSHALHQHRIGDLLFNAAIFTNLTGDHLDYHKTMEEYYQVKKMLFTRHLRCNGIAVINCDDLYGERLSQELASKQDLHLITFGRDKGEWKISNIKLGRHGSSFDLSNKSRQVNIAVSLTGLHNIYNTAGTVLALDAAQKIDLNAAAEILRETSIQVPGRLEAFPLPGGATAFVDYAHTHDALSNVLQSLKALDFKRIIVVFGAGGDRDRSKRPLMGKAAASCADVVILTSDNPRSENPDCIINEIRHGIPDNFAGLFLEPDRKNAIAMAVKMAAPGDAVLVAGKGHENYQEINGVKHSFDDREILKSIQL